MSKGCPKYEKTPVANRSRRGRVHLLSVEISRGLGNPLPQDHVPEEILSGSVLRMDLHPINDRIYLEVAAPVVRDPLTSVGVPSTERDLWLPIFVDLDEDFYWFLEAGRFAQDPPHDGLSTFSEDLATPQQAGVIIVTCLLHCNAACGEAGEDGSEQGREGLGHVLRHENSKKRMLSLPSRRCRHELPYRVKD